MRVLIAQPKSLEAQAERRAAYACWGDPPLVQVDVVNSFGEIGDRLADRYLWPDVILANLRQMEEHPEMAELLRRHPGHGFYRLVVTTANSDEWARAIRRPLGDAVVTEPVTRQSLVLALRRGDTASWLPKEVP